MLLSCKDSLIQTLINDICSLHESFSRDFFNEPGTVINMKKTEVRNVIFDEPQIIQISFLQLIQKYHDFLGKLIIYIDYEYDYKDLDFRLRIKQKDSIVNKLFHYKFGKTEEGKIPINKCVNDLLGFRIIIEDFEHNCTDFINMCDVLKQNYKINHIDSSKDGYKATHIYFLGKNNYFPWELQIWNSADELQNELSHKEHKSKREYINWPQVYFDSTEFQKKGGD